MSQTNPWHWEELLLLLEPVQDPGLVLALGEPSVLSSLLLSGRSRSCLSFQGSALGCQTPAAAAWGGWGSPLPALPKGYSLPTPLQVLWHPGMSDGNGVRVMASLCWLLPASWGPSQQEWEWEMLPEVGWDAVGRLRPPSPTLGTAVPAPGAAWLGDASSLPRLAALARIRANSAVLT